MAGKDTASGRWSRGKSCDWEMWEDSSPLTERTSYKAHGNSPYLLISALISVSESPRLLGISLLYSPLLPHPAMPPHLPPRSFLPTLYTELSLPCMPLHTLSTTVYFVNVKMLRVTNCIDTTEKQKRAST